MHNSTRPAEQEARRAPRERARRRPGGSPSASGPPATREEFFETRWGVGRVLLDGDLPLELDLPDPARAVPDGGRGGRWAEALERYFAGEPEAFDLDVDAFAAANGYTSFERDVVGALARVPYGTAVSYRDLAHAAGRPNAYRAVGSVMARNPLPVVLPCHRVIHNDGTLGRYGDDPTWKQRLLRLEGWSPGGETDRLRRRGDSGGRVRGADEEGQGGGAAGRRRRGAAGHGRAASGEER